MKGVAASLGSGVGGLLVLLGWALGVWVAVAGRCQAEVRREAGQDRVDYPLAGVGIGRNDFLHLDPVDRGLLVNWRKGLLHGCSSTNQPQKNDDDYWILAGGSGRARLNIVQNSLLLSIVFIFFN